MPDFRGPVFEHLWLPGILLSDVCSVSLLSTFHEIIYPVLMGISLFLNIILASVELVCDL